MAIGQFQRDIRLWGMNQDPKDSKESPLYAPETQVLIEVWKVGSPKGSTPAHMEGPLPFNAFYPHSSQGTRAHTPGFTIQALSCGRTQKRTLNTPVSPWEISATYSGLQISAIVMNRQKIKFLGINFIRRALASAWATLLSLCHSQGNSLVLRQTPL